MDIGKKEKVRIYEFIFYYKYNYVDIYCKDSYFG